MVSGQKRLWCKLFRRTVKEAEDNAIAEGEDESIADGNTNSVCLFPTCLSRFFVVVRVSAVAVCTFILAWCCSETMLVATTHKTIPQGRLYKTIPQESSQIQYSHYTDNPTVNPTILRILVELSYTNPCGIVLCNLWNIDDAVRRVDF